MATAVTACNSDQAPADARTASTTTQAIAEKAALSNYRFERPPAVVFASDNGPPGAFWVFVRMNRALPRDAHGIKATFQLDGGSEPFGTPVTNSRKPPCYSAEISAGDNPKAPPNIVYPRDGELVTVTLRFPGKDGVSATLAARGVPRSAVGLDRTNAKYLRRLGCHVSTR